MGDHDGSQAVTCTGVNRIISVNSVGHPVSNGPQVIDEACVDVDTEIPKVKVVPSLQNSTPQSEKTFWGERESSPAVLDVDNISTDAPDHCSSSFPRDGRLWSSLPRMRKDGPTGYIQVLGYKYLSSGGDTTPQIGTKKGSQVPLRDELPSPLVKATNEAFFFVHSKKESSNGQEASSRPPRVEKERIRRQNLTDGFSLVLLVPGLCLSVLSPFLLIPAYGFENPHVVLFRYLFFILTVVSVGLNIAGGMVGNVMWYFDESDNKWRFKLHCGRGPSDHYWGANMLKKKDKSLPDGIV